jgi:hypothetical protein
MTEAEAKIANLSGADFEITYTNCDTLAKSEFVSVYVSRAKVSDEPFYSRWREKKTLLFRYDPWTADGPFPVISPSGPKRISISVPKVSHIFLKGRSWNGISVDYQIGHVEYP